MIIIAGAAGCGGSMNTSAAARSGLSDAEAQAFVNRALKDIASGYQVFHSYMIVLPQTLKNSDHRLRSVSTLAASGTKTTFTVAVTSGSGTTFRVNGSGVTLTRVCQPSGAACPDGHWSGSTRLAMPFVPKLNASDKAAVRSILLGSVHHYASLLAQGQQAVGTTQYPNAQAGLTAFSDPNSAASQFSAYQKNHNPVNDTSYLDAFTKADKYFTAANEPNAITAWQNDAGNAQSDLYAWVNDAVSWQISEIARAKLQADVAKFEHDLGLARADAIKASS
ncbi:MAG TPA: hypothetical protein VFI54_07665 [Solirubrobacteraceae bacterium]|nr:hypothetical protein [Solirubrobacteraceae bacterium]